MATVFCPRCGENVTLPEERLSGFCSACGMSVTAPPSAAGDGVSVKSSRGSKFAMIGAAAIVVIVLAVILAVSATAGGSYEKAELAFIKSLTQVTETAGQKTQFSVAYEPSAELAPILGDISLAGTLSMLDTTAFADFILTANGDAVHMIAGYDENAITLSLPEISEYYFKYIVGEEVNFNTSELDMAELKKMLTPIMEEYFKLTNDAAVEEKNVNLTAGGITVKCTTYTIDFTYDMLDKLARTAIAELRKNDNLKEYLYATLGTPSYGYDFDDMLDELESALDEAKAYMDTKAALFRMTVWTDGNTIVAREISNIMGFPGAKFTIQLLTTGKAAYVNIALSGIMGNSELFSIRGNLEKNGDAWSGTIKGNLTIDGYYGTDFSITADLTDVKRSGDKLSGDIKLTIGGIVDGDNIGKIVTNASYSVAGGKQVIEISGAYTDVYSDRYDIGKLTISYSTDTVKSFDMPALSEKNAVINGDYSDEVDYRRDIMEDDVYYAAEAFYDAGNYLLYSILDEIYYMI